MPKYKFICSKCKKEEIKVVPKTWDYLNCECGGIFKKQLPILKKTTTKEKVDSERNIDWIEDQEKILEDRSKEHFWKYEVKKLVQSGEYSTKTMLENGWIFFDEKNNMQIRETAPNQEPNIKIQKKKKK